MGLHKKVAEGEKIVSLKAIFLILTIRRNEKMSFSSEVKEELSKIENLTNKEVVKQELIGYLLSCNILIN